MSNQDHNLTEPSGMTGAVGDIDTGDHASTADVANTGDHASTADVANTGDPNPSGLPDPATDDVPTENDSDSEAEQGR